MWRICRYEFRFWFLKLIPCSSSNSFKHFEECWLISTGPTALFTKTSCFSGHLLWIITYSQWSIYECYHTCLICTILADPIVNLSRLMLMDTASPTMINAKFFTVHLAPKKVITLSLTNSFKPRSCRPLCKYSAFSWWSFQCFSRPCREMATMLHRRSRLKNSDLPSPVLFRSNCRHVQCKGADWKENNWKSQGKEAGLGFNARVAPLSNVQWVYSFHIRPKEGVKFGEYRSSANWHSPGKGVNEQCFTCEIFDRIPPVHAHAQRFTLWIPSTQWWSGMGEHGWQVKDPNQPTLLHCRKLPSDCWHCWKRWREKKIQIW